MQFDPYQQQSGGDASTLGSKSETGDDQSIFNSSQTLPRIFDAGLELESLCRSEISGGKNTSIGFPPTCLPIVRLLAGNHCCVDCGDDRMTNLQYGSMGYGTLLCHDCAHRHSSTSGEESNVKHLKDEHWSLRSTLTMLEGSNNQMIDYVKHKPHWRPPSSGKNGSGQAYSEGDLAFLQIYKSKGAAMYRKDIAKKVDDKFYSSITNMRNEDAAREERLQGRNRTRRDPFETMGAGEIPGFFTNASNQSTDANGAGIVAGEDAALGDAAFRSSVTVNARVGERRGRNTSTLMKHEAPSKDRIKDRINTRRSMNSSIASTHQFTAREDSVKADAYTARNLQPDQSTNNVIASRYIPHSSRRRESDHGLGLVGEVGDTSIQDRYDYDDNTAIGEASYQRPSVQQNWTNQEEDEQTHVSHWSRSQANAPRLGMYRRTSATGK